jgi:hypothetical protein
MANFIIIITAAASIVMITFSGLRWNFYKQHFSSSFFRELILSSEDKLRQSFKVEASLAFSFIQLDVKFSNIYKGSGRKENFRSNPMIILNEMLGFSRGK